MTERQVTRGEGGAGSRGVGKRRPESSCVLGLKIYFGGGK